MRDATDPPPRWPFSPRAWHVLLFGVTPLLLLGGFASWQATAHYVQTNPAYCGQCHVTQDQYQFWAPSAHQKVACQSCHEQTVAAAADMFRAYVRHDKTAPAPGQHVQPLHAPDVPMNGCTGCHYGKAISAPNIAGSVGHEMHLKQPKVTCKSCHGKTIHGYAAATDSCSDCHKKETVQIDGMARLHCNACHSFTKRDKTLLPSQRDCVDCHAARGVATKAFASDRHMANFACSVCHRPHEAGSKAVVACASCHTGMERHGLHAIGDHNTCTDCHAAHTWEVTKSACMNCHSDMKAHGESAACQSCHKGK